MLIGHRKQWKILQGLVERGKIPHALLFSGEENLGKKTTAFEFIKLLNCENTSAGQPCQVCRACQEIEKRIYPDLVLIEPLEKREIGVAQIRELRSRLSLRSFKNCFKAAIIEPADFLTQEAQSSFLKLLEEPKGKTVFILIAEHYEMLLPTILSRCELLKFYPVPNDEIKKYLRAQAVPEDRAQEIVSFSWGRPGRAINFLLEPKAIEKYKQLQKELIQLTRSDLTFRFQYAKKISEQRQWKNVLDVWLRYFREKLLQKSQIQNYSLTKLRNILTVIQETQFLLSNTNVNPKLALEILMLEI